MRDVAVMQPSFRNRSGRTGFESSRNLFGTDSISRDIGHDGRFGCFAMAPRASWKGYLKLSLVSCPVALFPATTLADRVRFRTINRDTGNRIRQQIVDEGTGEVVEPENRAKGYEVGKSEYIIIEDDELEAVQIESSHTIEITEFVKTGDVDSLYLDEGYYLAPDDRVAVEPFTVIREAMRSTGTVGIAKVAMHRREKLLLLEPRGKGLLGKTIRYQYEVRPEDSYFADIPEVGVDADLLKLAEHIVQGKMGAFDTSMFEDRYENAIVDLIRAKREGRPAAVSAAPAPQGNVVNLMDALRRSVEAETKGGKLAPATKPAAKAVKAKAGVSAGTGSEKKPGRAAKAVPKAEDVREAASTKSPARLKKAG